METPRLTLNVLLSLLIQAKKQGKGKLGNGRMLVLMLKIIADFDPACSSRERSVIACFCDEPVKSCAYQKIDKQITKFLRSGSPYPYDRLHFSAFEKALDNPNRYAEYLRQMQEAFAIIVDDDKSEQLLYTILELLCADESIRFVLYGTHFVPKETLFGTYAHRKHIYAPALIFGLLYQLHKHPSYAPPLLLQLPPTIPPFYLSRADLIDEGCTQMLLNPDTEMPVPELLRDHAMRYLSARKQETGELYPLEFYTNNTRISVLPECDNICIFGIGGIGKTTFLRAFSDGVSVSLYLSPNDSTSLLLQIVMKYLFCGVYPDSDTLYVQEGTVHITQIMNELDAMFSANSIAADKQYPLLLDDIHALSSEQRIVFFDELRRNADKWKNVRLIIADRSPILQDELPGFRQIECRGFSAQTLQTLLPDGFPAALTDYLKIPLLLRFYLDHVTKYGERMNRAELISAYISHEKHRIKTDSETQMLRTFLLDLALPYAAFEAVHKGRQTVSRADFSASFGRAIAFYLRNYRVYQNYTAPNSIKKELLPEGSRCDEWFGFLLYETGILYTDSDAPELLHFAQPVFRDCFAAKHIQNLVNALDAAFSSPGSREFCADFSRQRLGELWFPEEDHAAYALVGELAGDDRNKPREGFVPARTFLDLLLFWARETDTFRLTENVIRTMSAARGNVICGVDFSGLTMPAWMPSCWKFSFNGAYPCSFANCHFGMLGLFDSDISMRRTPDSGSVWVCFSDGYDLLFDAEQGRVQEFSELPESAVSLPAEPCTEDLLRRLYAALPHFRSCDFTGAVFLSEQAERILFRTGIITA